MWNIEVISKVGEFVEILSFDTRLRTGATFIEVAALFVVRWGEHLTTWCEPS